jgi:enterobactin synthetase component D
MNPERLLAEMAVRGVSLAFAARSTALIDVDPVEAAAVASAVPGRRRDFLLGRQLLRQLLAERGCRVGPIGPAGPGGLAVPPEFAASISHSGGLVVAAVASAREYGRIGIDIELGQVPADVADNLGLTGPGCGEGPQSLGPGRSHQIDFSAREAVYKCLPAGLQESSSLESLELDYDRSGFTVAPSVTENASPSDRAVLELVSGSWSLTDEAAATLAVLSRHAPSKPPRPAAVRAAR